MLTCILNLKNLLKVKYIVVTHVTYDLLCYICVVSEVVQTLQLRDQTDAVGDLSVCLDGMTVDPEMFATAEADQHCK